ncbi:hypothetical protein BJV82DRAFT_169096 [Fennellomyces sp. T-0311]|nr:hypothetical protein BJV82DRAFT_169096 [Fennellomyces sp. T-0311]
MLPDFIVYAYVRSIRFDLLAVEIKPPESNKGEDDKRKIARELHLMINALVDNGVESPIVCGISVDGFKCATYQMDLKYDGIYRLTELSQFELPSNMEELGKSKRCLASFIKVQELISSTAERIENCLKSKRCTLNTVDPKLVPKEEWKRPSQDILSKMNKRPKK